MKIRISPWLIAFAACGTTPAAVHRELPGDDHDQRDAREPELEMSAWHLPHLSSAGLTKEHSIPSRLCGYPLHSLA